MAKNKVKVGVEVDDNGTLKETGAKAKAAAKDLDGLGKKSSTADRNLKGAAQASSNGTKNFSKMAQGISGGLVPAYATLAANVFAITAAFQFLKDAGDLAILEASQVAYANNTGRSMQLLTKELQGAARGMLSYQDAAQGAAIGAAAGLSNSQLEGLTDVAYRASVALGRDLTDSFNRLTRGAIKAEPELLDELGIIIRLDTVTKDYARSLGVAATSLTAFQRTQAVTNAIIDQADTKFEDLGDNVNQIARLGSAFRDLMKDIQQVIQPLTNFVGKVLADNVTALAGAFALLGAPLLAALTPAAPAFTNIKESADQAVVSLGRYAKETSKLGGKLAGAEGFDDLSDRDLNDLERTLNTKKSTILRIDGETKAGIVKNINVIKAQRKLLEADTKVGVKKVYAMWKAELSLLQAQHGRVIGTMKAGMLGFSRVANKALGAIGIIGLLTTALALLQELLKGLKDPALEKFRENLNMASAKTKAQVAEFERLGDKMKVASTEAEKLVQNANRLSNINFNHLKNIQLPRLEVENIEDFGEAGRSYTAMASKSQDFVASQLDALHAQRDLIASIKGEDSPEIIKTDKAIKDLNLVRGLLQKAKFAARFDTQDQANAFMMQAEMLLGTLPQVSQDLMKPITDASTALQALGQQGDSFVKLQDSLKKTPSQFESILSQVAQFSQLAQTGMIDKVKTVNDLTGTQRNSLEMILGVLDDTVTKEEILERLAEKRTKILEVERTLTRAKFELERKYIGAMSKATPLIRDRLASFKAEEKLQLQIADILAKHEVLNIAQLSAGDTQMKQDAQRIILLQEQLGILQQQRSISFQIDKAFMDGLEGGMQGQLAALIKGEESSLTDALRAITKNALTGVADVLAKSITQDLMSFIPGYETPEQKIQNAMKVGADYHAQQIIAAMKTGSGVPSIGTGTLTAPDRNKGGTSMRDLIDNSNVPVTSTYAKKGTPTTQATLTGPDGVSTIFAKNNAQVQTYMGDFTESLGEIFDPNTPFLEAFGNVFDSGTALLGNIFSKLGSTLGGLLGQLFGGPEGGSALKALGTAALSLFSPAGARYGGVLEGYSTGGIAKGSQAGFPAILHGTEAVVPLPHGNAIPVEMRGGVSGTNNVVVNVSVDSNGNATAQTESQSSQDAGKLGQMVSQAVQRELQNQKRSGGILNPYGAS